MNSNLNDLYVALLTIVVTLNGIAIPLSYNIVSENLKPYLDKNIYKKFIEERDFQINIILSFWCIVIFGLPLAFNLKSITEVMGIEPVYTPLKWVYMGLTILSLVGFLIQFVKFSMMIYEYAANTEEVVFEKIKEEIDEITKA